MKEHNEGVGRYFGRPRRPGSGEGRRGGGRDGFRPTNPKTLQENRESRQVPRLFCLPFAAVSHLRSLCKNNSLLQSAKEMAQCTRINAVARALLISTEGGCVAAIFL